MGALTGPTSIRGHHDLSRFDCGVDSLNSWLRSKARLNETRGGARTYVVCDGNAVVAFYSLAATSIERRRVSSRVGRNMPNPIPAILLGQLAVDTNYQGQGLGSHMMVDAGKRVLAAADLIGARAVMVQALDQRARAFYESVGFRQFSDREPLMLLARLSELKTALQS